MVILKFDENCTSWDSSHECNQIYLEMQRVCLNEKLRCRGYVYLNEIYEAFGAMWNPDDDNLCYRIECETIEIRFEPLEDGSFLVKIY